MRSQAVYFPQGKPLMALGAWAAWGWRLVPICWVQGFPDCLGNVCGDLQGMLLASRQHLVLCWPQQRGGAGRHLLIFPPKQCCPALDCSESFLFLGEEGLLSQTAEPKFRCLGVEIPSLPIGLKESLILWEGSRLKTFGCLFFSFLKKPTFLS